MWFRQHFPKYGPRSTQVPKKGALGAQGLWQMNCNKGAIRHKWLIRNIIIYESIECHYTLSLLYPSNQNPKLSGSGFFFFFVTENWFASFSETANLMVFSHTTVSRVNRKWSEKEKLFVKSCFLSEKPSWQPFYSNTPPKQTYSKQRVFQKFTSCWTE